MRGHIVTVAALALFATGARDNGCLGSDDGDETACPAIACGEHCTTGPDDANGCPTCVCDEKPAGCWSDSDCAADDRCDLTNYCDLPPGCDPGEACPPVCYGRCVKNEPPTGCWSDSDCAANQRCDSVNFCDSPPGCDPGEACPAVCYGRCVTGDDPNPCDFMGACADGEQCVNGACVPVEGSQLCEFTGGKWMHQSCGHWWCGQMPVCAALIPGCNCGEGRVFMEGAGCVESPECGSTSNAQVLCERTGGYWDERACGHAECGQTWCDAIIPGCNCGPSSVFDERVGCLAVPGCGGNACEGAFRDPRTGACLGPADQAMPDSCCESMPLPTCHDGTPLQCRMMEPDCAAPFVAAIVNGCYECLDPTNACQPACSADSDCEAGFVCGTASYDPCGDCDPSIGPCCAAPAVQYRVCRKPSTCEPVDCDLWCPNGYATDANGCQTCSCNDACVCTEEYAPVCGADGVTYSNACNARCAGVPVASPGACGTDCNVECFVYQPVCGTDGVTYGCGAADARCHGADVAYDGECRTDGGCGSNTDCGWGEKCRLHADGTAGTCVAADYCDAAVDCAGLAPTVSCRGEWSCQANRCLYACTR